MAVAQTPAAQRVVLHNVSWETYERLLAEHASQSAPRFTYDQGELEIMSPLPEHELLNRALQLLVSLVAYESGTPIRSLGSTTFRREEIERGFEPDSCFYIQRIDAVRGRTTIDLRTDPPPDLVLEIDITSPYLPKLPIYAAFGVPEIWRCDWRRVEILLLESSGYERSEHSRALPGVSATALTELLPDAAALDELEWIDRVRAWARSGLATPPQPPPAPGP